MALTNQELASALTHLAIDCMRKVNRVLGEDCQVMVNGLVTTRYLRGLLDELHVYCDELRRRLPDTGWDSLKYHPAIPHHRDKQPALTPCYMDDRHHYETLLYGEVARRRRRKAKLGAK